MKALIIDFGAERLDLLTAALDKFNIDYSVTDHASLPEVCQIKNLGAVILSGSLHCSFLQGSPDIDEQIYNLGVPILGICYGMQLTSIKFGGRVEKSPTPEFGDTPISFLGGRLFDGLGQGKVYMTHYDYVTKVPDGFIVTAKTRDCPVAALENAEKNIYLVQFHPEFFVSDADDRIFENFFYGICGFPKA